jgi:hypothetical protein
VKKLKTTSDAVHQLGMYFLSILFTLLIFAVEGVAQNLLVNTGATFAGTGNILVQGNIVNSGKSTTTTFPNTFILTGSNQQIGSSGAGDLQFSTLSIRGSNTKTINATITASESLNVLSGITLDISNDTLRVGKLSGNAGTITTTNGSVLEYTRNDVTAQSILGGTFSGVIRLLNSSAKNLQSAVVVDTLVHSGGDLTINQNLTVNYKTTVATIANISNTKTFALGSNASTISQITSITAGGALNVGTGALTVTTLSGNSGTISTGSGGATFTNGATNSGDITGGSGAILFSSTLGVCPTNRF